MIDFSACKVMIDGVPVPMSVETGDFSVATRGSILESEVPAAELKAELQIVGEPSGVRSYGDFMQRLEREICAAFLGPSYREQNGQLERRANCLPVNIHSGKERIRNAAMWEVIGTTRGRCRASNRLRKFVKRCGRIVEVRARGRSGFRSLEGAVRAAGGDSMPMGATFTVEAEMVGGSYAMARAQAEVLNAKSQKELR